jgi:hypothetical protein
MIQNLYPIEFPHLSPPFKQHPRYRGGFGPRANRPTAPGVAQKTYVVFSLALDVGPNILDSWPSTERKSSRATRTRKCPTHARLTLPPRFCSAKSAFSVERRAC